MPYLPMNDTKFGTFEVDALKEKGLDLHENYKTAEPFPHIVVDDFLPPDVLDSCLAAFPSVADPDSMTFDRDQERFKTSFNPDYLPAHIRALFYSFNSRPFLKFLENLTGIKQLIPDPFFLGGGFHEIKQGGHLSVHADFNFHKPMHLERRLNVLIYLNRDWKSGYGGALELWDKGMKNQICSIVPEFNRCVVFTTTGDSFHGNPEPVNHPDNIPRRSIALYYYTATWENSSRSHDTQFKPRPDSADKTDWGVKSRALMQDVMPPLLFRKVDALKHKIKR